MKFSFIFSFLLFIFFSHSQTIQLLTSGAKTSVRGLSVVNDSVLWASGSNGAVARSLDGGKTVEWLTVKGYEQRDFRDVEAFDSNTAIIMAVAEPAVILKTKDGGQTWQKVFEDSTTGMFLDAMDFVNNSFGVVIGDPINNKAFIAFTSNGGDKWNKSNFTAFYKDTLAAGEAFFASSGTNIKYISQYHTTPFFIYATGGKQSRFFKNFSFQSQLPLLQGKESAGANSIAVSLSAKNIVVVGGDYAHDKDTTNNCTFSKNMGKIWLHPQTPPHGYRSCVQFINDKQLIACGTSGIDISNDGGNNWQLISTESYHVCKKAKSGNAVFLAGKDGKIAKLVL